MTNRRPTLRRLTRRVTCSLSVLSLLSTSGLLLVSPRPLVAQTQDSERTDKNNKEKDDKNVDKPGKMPRLERDRKQDQKPANPLVLIDPATGSGNNTKLFNKDGTPKALTDWKQPDMGDYRTSPDDPRLVHKLKRLPLFGYDVFAQARLIIDRKRDSLLNNYDTNNTTRGTRSRSKTTQRDTVDRLDRNLYPDEDLSQRDNPIRRRPTDDGRFAPRDSKEGTGRTKRTDDTTDDNSDTTAKPRRGDSTDDTQDSTSDAARRVRKQKEDGTPDETASDTSTRDTGRNTPSRRSSDDDNTDDNTDTADSQNDSKDGRTSGERSLEDEQARQRRILTGQADTTNTSGGARRTPRRTDSNDDSMDGYDDNGDPISRRVVYDEFGYPIRASSSQLNSRSRNGSRNNRSDVPIDANREIADPFDFMLGNVIGSAPASYQLYAGDRVIVHISSATMAPHDETQTVDASGSLRIEDVGRISVAGKTLDGAERTIQQRIQRYFRNATVSLTLRETRTLPISIVGEAYFPGPRNVPALATALNVIYAAGGPTKNGSMRSIIITRQGTGKRLELDLYKLLNGQQADIPLQAGDIINIPPYIGRVSLRGEVRREAIYEIKEGETLPQVLGYAGNVKRSSADQVVQLNTLEPGTARVLKSVNLKDTPELAKTALYDGDTVNVQSLRPLVVNKVTVEGAVEQPSDYPLTPGMRVADLVRDARSPIQEAYLGMAHLYRWNPDNTTTIVPVNLVKAMDGDPEANLPLLRWDRLRIYTREESAFIGTGKVTVAGAVMKPGWFRHSANMHVSDLLLTVGGPMPDASLLVLTHQHGDGTYAHEFVNIADVQHGDKSADRLVEDNDLVSVYKNSESQFTPEHSVLIQGEVTGQGLYPRGENMRLTDLIKLAGNFKPGALPNVTIAHARRTATSDGKLETVSVKFNERQTCAPQDDLPLQDGDVVVVQGTGGLESKVGVVTVRGAVNKVGPIILRNKNMRLTDAIHEAGGLRPEVAFPEGAEFTRDSKMLSTPTQRDMAIIIGQLSNLVNDSQYKRELAKADIERIRAATQAQDTGISFGGGGAGANPAGAAAAVALTGELAKHSLVSLPRELTLKELEPYGNMAIDLPAAMRKPGGQDDVLLKDGDVINIPEMPTTVQVIGAVVNPRGVPFRPNLTLDDYIALSGSYAPDAAKDRMILIRANGGPMPARKAKYLRPGDVIVVPTKVLAEKISSHSGGIDGFFRGLTNSALTFGLVSKLF